MKKLIPFCLLILAGCQTPSPVESKPPAQPPPPVTVPSNVQAGSGRDEALERKVRQQAQYIEALISQNEALSSRLGASTEAAPYPSPAVRALAKPVAAVTPPAEPPITPAAELVLTPNTDGIIDLAAAVSATKPDETVNPFAVRTVPEGASREVAMSVGGIVAGPVACAVINDRLVQAGDSIEGLLVERIEPAAVVLKHAGQRLRLPVGGKNLRVRLPV